jgi:hypothetical protein
VTARERAWEEWIASRPECVQRLAREFPVGITLAIHGSRYYLLGYNESDMLLVSKINPREDYDGALAATEYIHADCVRKACGHPGHAI